jgi:hypothetical protein
MIERVLPWKVIGTSLSLVQSRTELSTTMGHVIDNDKEETRNVPYCPYVGSLIYCMVLDVI